jgi:hypothetical protein
MVSKGVDIPRAQESHRLVARISPYHGAMVRLDDGHLRPLDHALEHPRERRELLANLSFEVFAREAFTRRFHHGANPA